MPKGRADGIVAFDCLDGRTGRAGSEGEGETRLRLAQGETLSPAKLQEVVFKKGVVGFSKEKPPKSDSQTD